MDTEPVRQLLKYIGRCRKRQDTPHRMVKCDCGANWTWPERVLFIGPLEWEQRHLTIGSVGCKGCGE